MLNSQSIECNASCCGTVDLIACPQCAANINVTWFDDAGEDYTCDCGHVMLVMWTAETGHYVVD